MEIPDKRYLLAGAFVFLLLAFLAGFKYAEFRNANNPGELEIIELNPPEQPKESEERFIQVYICGEVKKPGVYSLKEDDRVYQLVELAEPDEKADLRFIEMARPLTDGETIEVPAEGAEIAGMQVTLPSRPPSSPSGSSAKVNINKANAGELADRLDGIGPALSQRIVDYREANGAFQKIEDIKDVSGIGEKKFESIKEHISVK